MRIEVVDLDRAAREGLIHGYYCRRIALESKLKDAGIISPVCLNDEAPLLFEAPDKR